MFPANSLASYNFTKGNKSRLVSDELGKRDVHITVSRWGITHCEICSFHLAELFEEVSLKINRKD